MTLKIISLRYVGAATGKNMIRRLGALSNRVIFVGAISS